MEKTRLDIKYIDKKRVRRTMSPVGMKKDMVYQAHSLKQEGMIAYVHKAHYDLAIKAMKSESPEVIRKTLADLGE